ncbi:MAG TPA: hypothetical protein VEB86_02790 [Chryseosolibacter sp.]|nr:hypothetical protein [Chryseosolibacter sp.]
MIRLKQYRLLSAGLLLAVNVLVACGPDEPKIKNVLVGKWNIYAIQSAGEPAPRPISPTYMLEFDAGYHYFIEFDINPCAGDFNIYDRPENLYLTPLACQNVCCDSPTAEDIKQMVRSADSFSLENDTLRIMGDGILHMKKIN